MFGVKSTRLRSTEIKAPPRPFTPDPRKDAWIHARDAREMKEEMRTLTGAAYLSEPRPNSTTDLGREERCWISSAALPIRPPSLLCTMRLSPLELLLPAYRRGSATLCRAASRRIDRQGPENPVLVRDPLKRTQAEFLERGVSSDGTVRGVPADQFRNFVLRIGSYQKMIPGRARIPR
jgi:hypothetical protein